MYDSTNYMLEKKILFTRTRFGKWPQIELSPRGAGQWCVTGLPGVTALTLPLPTHSLSTPRHHTTPLSGLLGQVVVEYLQGSS